MKTTLWLAEAQSSQRDMLLSLQALKPAYDLQIIASHRHDRPEILDCADLAYTEPPLDSTENNRQATRTKFVADNAIACHTKVLLTGRNGAYYEPHRQHLAQNGVRLLTGACDEHTLAMIDDKFAFTSECKKQGIAVADGVLIDNFDTLCRAIDDYKNVQVCIKPTVGIFAEGFWILDNNALYHSTSDDNTPAIDPFYHLYHTEPKRIATQSFLNAYQNSPLAHKTPMILMPYLAGVEHSIDVVCDQGEILGAVTRHKVGSVQHIGYDESVMAVVEPLIAHFKCDGIVSVQTKADDKGVHKVLEINPRPSGGIGYTVHSGLDLTQLAFLYFAGLMDKPNLKDSIAKITPCKVRPFMTSVKI